MSNIARESIYTSYKLMDKTSDLKENKNAERMKHFLLLLFLATTTAETPTTTSMTINPVHICSDIYK